MFARTRKLIASIDWEELQHAAFGAGCFFGLLLLGFWIAHSGWAARLYWLSNVVCYFVGWYVFGTWSRRRDRRRKPSRTTLLEPRRGFPPGVQVVEEIYSALRNLGYHEREVRQALYNLRARDLTDFDTGFKAAMAHLQSPQRAV